MSVKGKKVSKDFSLSKLFPNIVTITSICFGLSSIRYAMDQKWEIAVSFIIIAGFLDVVDGRLARFLKATSNFGAYLDSLADFIDFGVAPAVVLYMWKFQYIEMQGAGWALVLFFSVCMAIRLARFNSDLDDESRAKWKDAFFTGVPAPMGAFLAMIPMMLSFAFGSEFFDNNLFLLSVYHIIIALTLILKVPTLSTKKVLISKEHVPLFFVIFGLLVAALIADPWVVLPLVGLVYMLSMPITFIQYKKIEKEHNEGDIQ